MNVPSWVLGAADVRIAVLDESGQVVYSDHDTEEPVITLADAGAGRRPGRVRLLRPDRAHRRRTPTASPPSPATTPGTALILAQSLEPTHEALGKLGFVLTLFGLLGVVGAGVAGWAVARNGLRPVRRLTDGRREHRPHREARADRRRGQRRGRPAGGRVQRDAGRRSRRAATGSAGWSPTPATSSAPR